MTAPGPEPVQDALARLLDGLVPLDAVAVALDEALGAVAAEGVVSTTDLPRFDNAAMDGFAVRAADTAGASEGHPARLRRVGGAFAGTAPRPEAIGEGEAMEIATGAPLPSGADAVVRLERTTVHDDVVLVHDQLRRGGDVRRRGEDLRGGDLVVPAGSCLGPGQLAALAGGGHDRVKVHRRPTVEILLTGDEVAAGGQPLGPTQVHDAVGPAFRALLRDAGAGTVALSGPVGDARDRVVAEMRRSSGQADLVVTVGGVGRSQRDLVAEVVGQLGQVSAHGVALRPGAPFRWGRVGSAVVACLPGNPAAALVTASLFVVPVVRRLLGAVPAVPPPMSAFLLERVRQTPGRTRYLRALVSAQDGQSVVRPVGAQGAGMLHSLAAANAWLVLGPEDEVVDAGDRVSVVPMWGRSPTAAWGAVDGR